MRGGETEVFGVQRAFPQTDWALLEAAPDLPSVDILARRYWKPLYFFVRRHRFDVETSKDIVQGFLASVFANNTFGKADAKLGKFRTFVLAALTNFMKNWTKSASRLKRGGGSKAVSIESSESLATCNVKFASDAEPPEKASNRAWARSLLDQSIEDLDGSETHLQAFQLYLGGASYEGIAEKTGMAPIAAKVAVHRLRGKLRKILTARIAETVGDKADLSAELSEFVGLLS